MVEFILLWLKIIVPVFLGLYLQVIIHEGGHLVCGLLSGYEFVSFRVESLLIKKENGRFVLRRYGIPGTSGQCLLKPKAETAEEGKYRLYNAGGVLANFITGALFFAGYRIVDRQIELLSIFFLTSALMALVLGLMNGIPLKIGGIANDGHNMLSLEKDPPSKYGFWLQMKVNALLSEGWRLKDMPQEWFILEEDADLNNPLLCAVALLHAQYYQDKGDYDKAGEMMRKLIDQTPKLMPLFLHEMTCSLMLFELLGECRQEEIERMYTKELKTFMKQSLKFYPAKNSLMYAYEMLVKKDAQAAEKYLAKFEKLLTSYPYPGEAEAEKEHMARIMECIHEKKNL